MMDRTEIDLLFQSVFSKGGSEIEDHYPEFDRQIQQILRLSPKRVTDLDAYKRCIQCVANYANWKWDARVASLQDPCGEAIQLWCNQPEIDVDLICYLMNFYYFLSWCFNISNQTQCERVLPAMRAIARRTGSARPGRLQATGKPLKVAYLTRFATFEWAGESFLEHVMNALLSRPDQYKPIVYVWERIDSSAAGWLDQRRISHAILKGETPSETIEAVATRAALDTIDIVLSLNTQAVSTILFSRRIAPLQMFIQLELPAWGTLNLDAVFSGYGFDSDVAGWGTAQIYPFLPPWNLDFIRGAPTEQQIAEQRQGFPEGMRVIGCYARLVKFTEAFVEAAERILAAHADVCLLLGGTGDIAMLETLIQNSPFRDRTIIRSGYVPGRVWARILYLFLDTWPVPGAGSIREVTAVGVPVVSIHNTEMPALEQEKDPELITSTWDEYVNLATRLLTDEAFYRRAHQRALEITARMLDRSQFETQFLSSLEHSIALASASSASPGEATESG